MTWPTSDITPSVRFSGTLKGCPNMSWRISFSPRCLRVASNMKHLSVDSFGRPLKQCVSWSQFRPRSYILGSVQFSNTFVNYRCCCGRLLKVNIVNLDRSSGKHAAGSTRFTNAWPLLSTPSLSPEWYLAGNSSASCAVAVCLPRLLLICIYMPGILQF